LVAFEEKPEFELAFDRAALGQSAHAAPVVVRSVRAQVLRGATLHGHLDKNPNRDETEPRVALVVNQREA
jgi:hypothetical protein